jgi:Cu(I)/Ag(I) efflux system membrane fusion protein
MRYLFIIGTMILLAACQGKIKQAVVNSDTYYTCSMHPQIMQDAPGKCPVCGMELIAVEKGQGQAENAIMLSEQQVQLGNIKVDTLGRSIIGDKIVLTATLNVDETKSASVNARIAGRIEKLYFKNAGDYLRKGDRLYDLYSEQLNNAKQEYLLALEKQRTLDNSIIDFKQLIESAKNKLVLWGMSEGQVEELAKTKNNSPVTAFYSPVSGHIATLESHEGDYLAEGTTILRVANLSSLWAEAQVYTSQLSTIDRGGAAAVQLPDIEMEINGKIEFVNPEINPDTRINLIRVAILNTGNRLKPGMPAYVVLKNRQTKAFTVPIDAVIRNEKHSVVWLQTGHNTYKSVMVETGVEDGDRIEIKSGIKEGDVVVINGAYLLNSEYIIKRGANPMEGHDMGNMKM